MKVSSPGRKKTRKKWIEFERHWRTSESTKSWKKEKAKKVDRIRKALED